MNWDAISAIAEVAGVIAVLFTLLYLARQIKSSSDVSKAELFERTQDRFSRVRSMFMQYPEIALKLSDPKDLTEEQILVAQSIVMEIVFAYGVSYENQTLLQSSDRWDVVSATNHALAGFPAFRATAIEQLRENAFEDFADKLEAGIRRHIDP